MPDKIIKSIDDLKAILSKVSFAPSCVNLDWEWEIETIYEQASEYSEAPVFSDPVLKQNIKGFLVNTSFLRPERTSGEITRGRGRQEFIPIGASESSVVKTIWLLAELIVRHELMEAFHYNGYRIFDPHNSVEELAAAQHLKKGEGFACDLAFWKKQ